MTSARRAACAVVVAVESGIAAAELVGVVAGDVSGGAPNPVSVLVAAGLTAGFAIWGLRRPTTSGRRSARRSSVESNAIEDHGWEGRDEGALVDAAVGALGEALRRRDAGSAVPLAVHVGEELVEVFWDRPPPPATKTFRASSTGWVWTTHPDQLVAYLSAEGPGSAGSLLPTLVPAGATGLGDLWLNLEGFGLLNLVGEATHAEAAVRHLVSSVTSPVADVMVVGTPDDTPAPFGVGVAWVTVEQALMEVRRRRARLGRELEDRAWTSVLTARLRDASRAHWRPLVLAVIDSGSDVDTLDHLARAARGSRSGSTCLVINRAPDDETTPIVCGAGVMHLPMLGGISVAFGDPGHAPTNAAERGEPTREGVEVRLLGPVEVAGACSPLSGKGLELVAYLACHRDGVADDRIKTVLWPARLVRHESWLNRLSAARQALGTDANGEWSLPYVEDGMSRLAASVTTDVDAMETALREADGAPADAAIELLRGALARVRGRPLEERAGYEWAFGELHVARAERIVGDAAHQLAQLALAADDWRLALWAAEQGLLAVPASEPLARDRMRAFAAAGDVRGVRRALRDLLASLDSPDEPAAISAETRELYDELCAPVHSVAGWAMAPVASGSADRPVDR